MSLWSHPVKMVAPVVAVVCLAALSPGVGEASEPGVGRDSATVTPTSARAAALVGIDTTDRAAVNRAYLRRMGRYLGTRIRWDGSISRCRAGKPSRASQLATLSSLNFVRAMGHLGPVAYGKLLSAKAQKAALIMSANNSLSHSPPKSWDCWSAAGAEAAGKSNLAFAFPEIRVGNIVKGYMDDPGSSNIAVGHRRWLMNPAMTKVGSGTTNTANAIWVIGPSDPSRPDPTWVSWPTAGWFPSPLEPDGRWSLSASDTTTDFSRAQVSVRNSAGTRHRVRVYPVANGFGNNTLAWATSGLKATGKYTVTVRGIDKTRARPRGLTHRYVVRLFQPGR